LAGSSNDETASAPKEVLDLVERFESNRSAYESGHYNETQVRREFIDPLLKALGWDIDNTAGYAEAYKDVVHEDAIRVEGSPKAPDYSVRIGGTRKFFVEAKKPSVNLKTDAHPAYQLRRYAWSAKLPLSILTDFAELAVYDCRVTPEAGDGASKARVIYMTCDEYATRWDELVSIFSRNAVLKGSFDAYAEATKAKRGTTEVDAAFLAEIETWRDDLARNIALRNRDLTARELNFAVQTTIDRIVFLRICEDRGLEPYGSLRVAAVGKGVYERLMSLFHQADGRYNSGLFHFAQEKGRGEPDDLTPSLKIDDKTLREIVSRLYYPTSPYEFSVISADILGQVYEQFLGRVISLSPGRRVTVEEKPEVKKAGGVYYTPAYVVQFIVERAVGNALAERDPERLLGGRHRQTFRVVDPACGSGSFLIAAYQHLLDWYLSYFVTDAERWAKGGSPRIFSSTQGEWRLTTRERKRILTDHIFGVDIDPQAVEVTKLSLMLKVLEGESDEMIQLELRLFNERALPDLDNNIKCGNSLVGSDVYEDAQMTLLTDEEQYRINVFDWEEEFGGAMKEGGFDVVTGNPPYVYRNATEDRLRPYYARMYSVVQGNYDLYKFFLERGLSLLKTGGRLGFIVSASFLVQPTFSKVRALLLNTGAIEELAPLGPGVFIKAAVDSTIVVVRREDGTVADAVIDVRAPVSPTQLPGTASYPIPQRRFETNPGMVFDYRLTEEGAAIVNRIFEEFPTIESGFEFGVGINTGFIKSELVAPRRLDERYHPMVPGTGIARYGSVRTDGWIMYDPEYVKSRGSKGRSLPPERFFLNDKILIVRTRNLSIPQRIVATIDDTQAFNLNRLSNIIARSDHSLLGLLGILNSSLFNWLYSTRFYDYEIKPVYLRDSPLADVNDAGLNAAVSRIVEAKTAWAAARTNQERAGHARRAGVADREVDRIVYGLYGVQKSEIDLIEAQLGKFAARVDREGDPLAVTAAA
jgi:hypothetical protein